MGRANECLPYIELNMVRCGVVAHPREWLWVGYHEIMGHRQRYRLLDLDRLCWRLRTSSLQEVRQQIGCGLAEKIARGEVKRQEYWTEGLAIGSQDFVEKSKGFILSRAETQIIEHKGGLYVLAEQVVPYTYKTGQKNAANALQRV